jgi:hypothetical protein
MNLPRFILKPENFPLLRRLLRAVRLPPGAPLIFHGGTHSVGTGSQAEASARSSSWPPLVARIGRDI